MMRHETPYGLILNIDDKTKNIVSVTPKDKKFCLFHCSMCIFESLCTEVKKEAPDIDELLKPDLKPVGKSILEEIRTFSTGATRDNDKDKFDYEGFLCPLVLKRYGQYMHKHRIQPDGSYRDSDNWQKGMPLNAYMKSLSRHEMDLWLIHRGFPEEAREGIEDVLCAIMFNTMGYLREVLKTKKKQKEEEYERVFGH
jgi:hypothetical protein